MPDGDVIKRGVRHAWRAAYESLSAGGADADVEGQVARGLTASLRKRAIPSYEEAASLVADSWNHRVPQSEALARVPNAVGSIGGTRAAALLEVAVQRVILGGPTGANANQAIVEAYLNAEVDAELMSKVRPAMIEGGQHDPSTVEETIARWTEAIQKPISKIAKQLIDDPSGRALRAPRSHGQKRRNTVEILDEAV